MLAKATVDDMQTPANEVPVHLLLTCPLRAICAGSTEVLICTSSTEYFSADLRSRGMGFASFLRDKTKAASESLKQRDWTREQQALSSIKTWGTGCVFT